MNHLPRHDVPQPQRQITTPPPSGQVTCCLSEIMGRHRLTQTALAQVSGLRPATISALYHDRTDAIAKGTLTRLLGGLHHLTGVPYQVGDILQLRQ